MSSHPSASFLAQLTGTLDRLDPVLDPQAARRQKLIDSAQAICQSQQIFVTEEAIADAVDQQLAEVPIAKKEVSSPSGFDFGWDRPASLTELGERKKFSRWTKAVRFLSLDTWQSFLATVCPIFLVSIGGAAFLGGFSSFDNAVGSVLASSMLTFCVSLPINFFCLRWMAQKNKVEPTEIEESTARDYWMKHPKIRAYVRQCMLSPVPQVLNGDEEQIWKIYAQEDALAKTVLESRSKVENRQRLTATLWTLAEMDENVKA